MKKPVRQPRVPLVTLEILRSRFRSSVIAHVLEVARFYGALAKLIEEQADLAKKVKRRRGSRRRVRR